MGFRTNDVERKNIQDAKSNRCGLCGDRDKTTTHINEYSKLVQKEYKTRHDWARKGIPWELCKKFEFDHMNKCYMHNSESVLENEIHKILWDSETETDRPISARRPDLVIVNKHSHCRIVDFAVPADHGLKLQENEKRNKYLHLTREWKNYGIWKWW